jgi:hypothetical protein
MTMSPSTIVVLIVSPSLNTDGGNAFSSRGQLFDGMVDGRSIVKRSTTPFCDAARALLAEGIKPDTNFVMRHLDSASDALRSTVAAAANLTVTDDSGGKPVVRNWRPYDAHTRVAVAPPMRETDPAAVLVPSRPGRILEDLSHEFKLEHEDTLLREIEAPEPAS